MKLKYKNENITKNHCIQLKCSSQNEKSCIPQHVIDMDRMIKARLNVSVVKMYIIMNVYKKKQESLKKI